MNDQISKVPEEVPGVFSLYDVAPFEVVNRIGIAINEPIVESGTPGDAVWNELEQLFMRLTP